MKDYEKDFEEFWKPIVCKKDGTIKMTQLKKELHDYHNIMSGAAHVYDHVTGGRISNPLTLPEIVCRVADDVANEGLEELCKDCRGKRRAIMNSLFTDSTPISQNARSMPMGCLPLGMPPMWNMLQPDNTHSLLSNLR